MPFVISHESLKSFEKDRMLKIESFLSPSVFDSLKISILNALSLGTHKDLFRSALDIKKALLKKSSQKMVCELCNEKRLFFAFDQLLDSAPLSEPGSLQAISSIFPLRLGGLFCWQGESSGTVFPEQPNDLLLFDPLLMIPWNELPKGQRFFLFAFASSDAVYQINETDPYTDSLKRLDYQHNQPISLRTHPLIKA